MSIATGTVTGREIAKNKDGTTAKMMLQVQITDPQDIQRIELMQQAGESVNPPDGSRVLIVDVDSSFRVAVASDDNIVPTVAEGEKKIYSIDAGTIAAVIHLLTTGVIELNGGGNSAVAFAELKSGFDQLVTDFNAHIHAETGVNTAPPTTSSTASIDSAESDTVQLP